MGRQWRGSSADRVLINLTQDFTLKHFSNPLQDRLDYLYYFTKLQLCFCFSINGIIKLLLTFRRLFMKKQNRLLSLILSLFLLLFTLVPQSALTVKAEGNSEMAVHFIDVGQGNAILVQSGGQNLLYDGGDQSHVDLIISYLQEQNVENIDYMIASHYDEDHIGGLVPCIDNFSVSNIFGPDYVLENGSNSFIFTGDAEETSEQDMISTGMNLDCDVLSVGHHGSASSTTWDFLEATSPSYAVISCGINNQYNHPSADTMGRLSDMGIPVFRTDKQGTIIAVSDGTNISWSQEPCNDYSSGDSSVNASAGGTGGNSWQEETTTSDPVPEQEESNNADVGTMVWIPATGEKYHSIPNCGRMNPDTARQVSRSEAEAMGYGPCSKCY